MRARVYNDNPTTDWKEKFKGEEVFIPKGSFIEMEFYEANEFKGQFSPIKKLPDESQDPKSYKTIRIVRIKPESGEVEDAPKEIFPCNMCKKAFHDEVSLLAHSEKSHADSVVVDTMAEEEIPVVDLKGKPRR